MNCTSEKKLRYSKHREQIYEYLRNTKEHPSAEMIYDALRGEIQNLSLGTVYRNLKQLEDMGKVIRVTTIDNRERYDAFCDDHVHFVCDRCGQVLDIMEADMAAALTACHIDPDTTLKRISIVIGGTCSKCPGV